MTHRRERAKGPFGQSVYQVGKGPGADSRRSEPGVSKSEYLEWRERCKAKEMRLESQRRREPVIA